MIERVISLLREVAGELVLPRFDNLADGDVPEKSPGDLVTIVDSQTEEVLQQRLTAYLPDGLKEQVTARSAMLGTVMPPQFCAGREYPNLARGVQHFTLFWRSLAWDHAPGTLFVREAGGVVRHFDGSDYIPVQPKPGLLARRDEHVFNLARQTLLLHQGT